jgi:D-alanyl-D-alanine carboxypeptidase
MHEFKERIKLIHRELGIPAAYESEYGLVLQKEETVLIEIGNDIYGRAQRLAPAAADAWRAMKEHALKEGVVLNVVSAFRAVDKQSQIIQRKLDSGQYLSEILKVCAAPGYSEHHTGRALDLASNGSDPLTEAFATTEAFRWLEKNAHLHAFSLSYPKRNKFSISYQPWHWAYNPD